MNRAPGVRAALILSAVAALAACSGGGGDAPAPAVITTQPADQSAVEGTTATFAVVATAATGYQWQRSTNGGATFSDLTAAISASYVTPVTAMSDHGARYRVVVAGAGGSVTSIAATLTVTAAPVAPAFTAQPADVTVLEGQDAPFTAEASGTPAPTLQWQQSTDGGVSWTDLGAPTTLPLQLVAVTLSSSGRQYRAVASNAAGTATSNTATLTVHAVPAITTQPASATVLEGQAAQFVVAASGTPAPAYQWQQSIDGGATWTDVAGATGATLDVPAVTLSSSGWQYRAVASNAAGTATSNAATLTVQAIPAFTTQPASVAVPEGQNARFTVAVSGAPAPSLQWQQSIDGGASWTDVAGATGLVLDVLAVAKSSNGWQYRAVATNVAGSATSAAATLTVQTAPVFGYQPTAQRVTAGKNARFLAIASGNPSPAYRWQESVDGGATWTDLAAATSAALDLVAVPLTSNGRRYRAVASNAVGTATSNAAALSVEARGWTVPALVENGVGDPSSPSVAVDGSGNAMAVWLQDGDPTAAVRYDVWASRYSAGAWSAPALIETDDTGSASEPQVAFDGGGNALVVWSQNVGGSLNVWANRHAAGAWGTATLIGSAGGFAYLPRFAVSSSGQAMVAWVQVDTAYHIWATRYLPGTGWDAAKPIESNVATAADAPAVAIDGAGNAFVVWSQTISGSGSVWANLYLAGTGWGTATLIEPALGAAYGARVAFGSGGTAVATWARTDGKIYSVWSSSYSAGAWRAPTLLEQSDAGSAGAPQLAMDSLGNGIAIWSQSSGTINDIWANTYAPGTGWGTAALLETNNGSFADNVQVGFDGSGNAMAIWKQYRPIAYNRYDAGLGWGAAAQVDANLANQVTTAPQLAVEPGGNAVAVWIQSDGTNYHVVASFYR